MAFPAWKPGKLSVAPVHRNVDMAWPPMALSLVVGRWTSHLHAAFLHTFYASYIPNHSGWTLDQHLVAEVHPKVGGHHRRRLQPVLLSWHFVRCYRTKWSELRCFSACRLAVRYFWANWSCVFMFRFIDWAAPLSGTPPLMRHLSVTGNRNAAMHKPLECIDAFPLHNQITNIYSLYLGANLEKKWIWGHVLKSLNSISIFELCGFLFALPFALEFPCILMLNRYRNWIQTGAIKGVAFFMQAPKSRLHKWLLLL